MSNNSAYTFQRISPPNGSQESLKAFTRKVNEGFEALTTKLWGYIEYKDLNSTTKTQIIDATLGAAKFVKDLAAKIGIGDIDYISPTEPENPASGEIWCDTSVTPSLFKKRSGTEWLTISTATALAELMDQIPYSSLSNGDLRTLLENVTHNVNGILLTGLGGSLQLLLGPGRISFIDSGSEVAYITGNKLYINSAELISEIKIGNYYLSKTADGGLVFK